MIVSILFFPKQKTAVRRFIIFGVQHLSIWNCVFGISYPYSGGNLGKQTTKTAKNVACYGMISFSYNYIKVGWKNWIIPYKQELCLLKKMLFCSSLYCCKKEDFFTRQYLSTENRLCWHPC